MELAVKLLSFLGGLIAIWRVFFTMKKASQKQLKEDFKFSKEFLNDLENLHPHSKIKGYQALAGSEQVYAHEVEYILTLSDPVQSLKDYVLSKQLFVRERNDPHFKFKFRGRYAKKYYRNVLKVCYFSWYVITVSFAVSPLILPSFKTFGLEQGLLYLMFTAPIGGFYAWASLTALFKLKRSDDLMNKQETRISPLASIHTNIERSNTEVTENA